MSQYTSPNTVKEFIQRTNVIIRQYKSQENYLGEKYYDVTLNLNCMLGLVVLPREAHINKLPNTNVPDIVQQTLVSAKDTSNNNISVRFKEYIIGLRNGIIHFGQSNSLKFTNRNGKIAAVELEGNTNGNQHTLKYRFNLEHGDELSSVISEILTFVNI